MRIGFDAKRLFNNYTGLGNYSRFVVDALVSHFPENEYVLFTPKVKQSRDTKAFIGRDSVQIVEPSKLVSKLGLKSFWRSVKLGDVAKQHEVEIFHGLSNELPRSKPSGLKTVITIHDLIFKRYPSFYKPIDIKIYDYKLRKALETTDAVIAISQQTARDISSYYDYPLEKIDVVYQGCHSIFLQRHNTEILQSVRNKYALPAQFILNVGTLEDRKNAILIVNALKQVESSVSAVFVGRETSYTAKIKQVVKENNLDNRVHFIHKVEFKDLPAIYQLAETFVYPSLFEGFGIPIVESIASGTPVVAANTSSLPEAGGPDTVYIAPDNDAALANEINNLIENKEHSAKVVSASSIYIDRFAPARIASDMMEVYRRLA